MHIFMCLFVRLDSHVAAVAGLPWDNSYPFVWSVVPKNLRFIKTAKGKGR